MSKTYKDKPKNDEKLKSSPESDLFAEKVKAAYSQMGKLGGRARAKQMAERGFQPKSTATQPDDKKSDKAISKKTAEQGRDNKF